MSQMNLQNRQRIDQEEDFENQEYTIYNSNKSVRKQSSMSKKIILSVLFISILFFGYHFIFKSSNQDQKKKKIDNLVNRHKNDSLGPQISSNQTKKKQKNETSSDIMKEDEKDTKHVIIPEEEQNEKKKETQKEKNIPKSDENKNAQKQNTVFICPNDYYSQNQCSKECEQEFRKDDYDRFCKPKKMKLEQIAIKYYPENNTTSSENQQSNQNIEFYQVLKSEDTLQNNSTENGFFFFNNNQNGGFNFLVSQFGGKKLNRFLNNIDGIIVSFQGCEEYYIKNEDAILQIINQIMNKYSFIKNWYTIGLFKFGGYTALRYLSLLRNKIDGSVVIDPDFMKMYNQLSELQKYGQVNHSDLEKQFQQESSLFRKKDVIIIERQNSDQHQFTNSIVGALQAKHLIYENDKYQNEKQKIEELFLSMIEQLVSNKNKQNINKF